MCKAVDFSATNDTSQILEIGFDIHSIKCYLNNAFHRGLSQICFIE